MYRIIIIVLRASGAGSSGESFTTVPCPLNLAIRESRAVRGIRAQMDLSRMPVTSLIHGCREETGKYRRNEPFSEAYCLELFRRAVRDRDEACWVAIVDQYRGSVLAWVRRHSTAGAIGVDEDEWVNDTFARFWKAFTPERLDQSLGLATVLKYLQMCVHSVVMDRWRQSQNTLMMETSDQFLDEDEAEPSVDSLAEGKLAAAELWQAIREELADAAERKVVYLSFVLGLKPGQVHERYPSEYPSPSEVYRIKRNALDRLRRSPKIREFLE